MGSEANLVASQKGSRIYYADLKTYGTEGSRVRDVSEPDVMFDDSDHKRNYSCLLLYLICTLLIFGAKIALFIYSNSRTVIMSTVDSAGDLLLAILVLITFHFLTKARRPYPSPQGFDRMHSVAVIIICTILFMTYGAMMYSSLASVLGLRRSNRMQALDELVEQILQKFDLENSAIQKMQAGLRDSHSELENHSIWVSHMLSYAAFFLTQGAVGFYLNRVYKRTAAPLVRILWLNNVFDMFISASVIAGFVGVKCLQRISHLDSLISLIIAMVALGYCYVMFSQLAMLWCSIQNLAGRSPSPMLYEEVTRTADEILNQRGYVDSLFLYAIGGDFIAEVVIRIPNTSSLENAVKLLEDITKSIEDMFEIERAFVSLKTCSKV